jgi:hypothetical protein
MAYLHFLDIIVYWPKIENKLRKHLIPIKFIGIICFICL